MAMGRSRPSWSTTQYLLLGLLLWISHVQGLYFYIDPSSSTPKCFYEELPKGTLVVGTFSTLSCVLLVI